MLKGGTSDLLFALNRVGHISRDKLESTDDRDPQLDAGGVPRDLALVDGEGPIDTAELPFAGLFVRDAVGACVQRTPDIGAFEVPCGADRGARVAPAASGPINLGSTETP